MATLKDFSKAYEPPKTKNIADMDIVDLGLPIEERTGSNKDDGKEFKYSVIIRNGEEFRVPASVLNSIKTILEAKPSLTKIKVLKKGTGMATEYTVIPMD